MKRTCRRELFIVSLRLRSCLTMRCQAAFSAIVTGHPRLRLCRLGKPAARVSAHDGLRLISASISHSICQEFPVRESSHTVEGPSHYCKSNATKALGVSLDKQSELHPIARLQSSFKSRSSQQGISMYGAQLRTEET